MSTYYEYKEVGVMIAHKLMAMDGWKVYGYHEDESDSMTDYYSPAYWNGVAEKNGYILCVNVYGEAKPQEITRYNKNYLAMDSKTNETIKKLEAITTNRGASEQEEETAKAKIELLRNKVIEKNTNISEYEVIGVIPGHMAHPPKCNWHIEKDGVIVEKGNGILKYASINNYYVYPRYMEDLNKYKKDKKEYAKKHTQDLMNKNYYSEVEKAERATQSHIEELEKDIKMIKQFELFINKIDTACGGILGSGELVTYEKVIKMEYKTENKAVETSSGSIKEGQCFILKNRFSYGCSKGLVYRIHEVEENGKKYYHAYKLNGKLTKECTGRASQNNYWYIGSGTHDNLTKWIEKGSIAWCDIQEMKTPYEVEKVVKKVIKEEVKVKGDNQVKQTTNDEEVKESTENKINYTYDINEDIDTRDNTKIYVVKVIEKLDKDEYISLNQYIKSIGGYYSKFKHGFIFKNYPIELMNNDENIQQEDISLAKQQEQQPQEEVKKELEFEIVESKHTETKTNIWLVRIKNELSKDDFAEIKRNFATLKGFYSSLNNSFIFKYNPTEILKNSA